MFILLLLFCTTAIPLCSTSAAPCENAIFASVNSSPIVSSSSGSLRSAWAILVCGSDDYNLGFQNDLEDMYTLLKNELGYQDDHIFYVAPSNWQGASQYYEVSKANVSKALAEVSLLSTAEDVVFLYYTAHGAHASDYSEFYLDANGDNKINLTNPEDDISSAELAGMLANISSTATVVVLQGCYTGGFANNLLPSVPNLVLITSTNSTMKSWEDMGPYGDPSWDPNGPDDDGNPANGDDDGSEFSSGFREAFRDTNNSGFPQADEFYYNATFCGNKDEVVSVLEAFQYAYYANCYSLIWSQQLQQAGYLPEPSQMFHNQSVDPSQVFLYMPSFELAVVPASQQVLQGGEVSFTVQVLSVNGFSSTVQLSLVCEAGSGISGSFDPNVISPGEASVLKVKAASNTPPGSYELTIVGNSSGMVKTVKCTLTVKKLQVPVQPLLVVTLAVAALLLRKREF